MIFQSVAILALAGLQPSECFLPRNVKNTVAFGGRDLNSWRPESVSSPILRSSFIVIDSGGDDEDEEDDEDDEDEEEEDPYTKIAGSEFMEDEVKNKAALSTMSASSIDWGGALGKLRQRVEDIDSGKSQDPSTALFRLMSAETPNQLIGKFVSTADPKVVKACSDAVNSLLGGLSSPNMGVETIVKTSGEKIGSLCFQLMMTGYLFRNCEYILALKEMMKIHDSATLQDYKVRSV